MLILTSMADRKDFLKDMGPDKAKSLDAPMGDKPRVIDFNIFKTEYWGCLSGSAPASCSPELLFAEIMGVIKGSGVTAKSLKPLTRPDYVKKNAKASPAFASEADREKVFASFERYEKQKKLRKESDELDRVSGILKSLRDNKVLAEQIRHCFEEIYVDGGSSFKRSNITVTKFVSRNPRLALSRYCPASGMPLRRPRDPPRYVLLLLSSISCQLTRL
jgi:hypothetical protein